MPIICLGAGMGYMCRFKGSLLFSLWIPKRQFILLLTAGPITSSICTRENIFIGLLLCPWIARSGPKAIVLISLHLITTIPLAIIVFACAICLQIYTSNYLPISSYIDSVANSVCVIAKRNECSAAWWKLSCLPKKNKYFSLCLTVMNVTVFLLSDLIRLYSNGNEIFICTFLFEWVF